MQFNNGSGQNDSSKGGGECMTLKKYYVFTPNNFYILFSQRKDAFDRLLSRRKEQAKDVKTKPTRAEAFGVYVGTALEEIPPQFFSSACQDIQSVISKYDINY